MLHTFCYSIKLHNFYNNMYFYANFLELTKSYEGQQIFYHANSNTELYVTKGIIGSDGSTPMLVWTTCFLATDYIRRMSLFPSPLLDYNKQLGDQ